MRPNGEQFVDRRGALAVRERQARTPAAGQLVIRAERGGNGVKLTAIGPRCRSRPAICGDSIVFVGVELGGFDPHAGFEPERAFDQGLKGEETERPGRCCPEDIFRRRARVNLEVEILNTRSSRSSPPRSLWTTSAAKFAAVGEEARSDQGPSIQLVMLVLQSRRETRNA